MFLSVRSLLKKLFRSSCLPGLARANRFRVWGETSIGAGPQLNSSLAEPATGPENDNESMPVVLIDPRGEEPIRAELLGVERLEAHARRLAPVCVLAPPGACSQSVARPIR